MHTSALDTGFAIGGNFYFVNVQETVRHAFQIARSQPPGHRIAVVFELAPRCLGGRGERMVAYFLTLLPFTVVHVLDAVVPGFWGEKMAVRLLSIRSTIQSYLSLHFGQVWAGLQPSPSLLGVHDDLHKQQGHIKTVTVAGITGALGPPVIEALVAAGFHVQAFTRSHLKRSELPVRICQIDYQDRAQLIHLLRDQDAVVSCLGDTQAAVAAQCALIEASIEAGVKRFIPSEFGSDTTNARVKTFPFFKHKIDHQDLLHKAAAVFPTFTYSLLITGPFLDWGLSVVPFIINVGSRSTQVYDGGDVPFSVTRLAAVGRAVASILKQPKKTANRVLFVHETFVTQNQLIAVAGHELSTRDVSFGTTTIDCRTYETSAWKAFDNPETDPLDWIVPFINLSIWSADARCHFQTTDNALLGIQELHGRPRLEMLEHEIHTAVKALRPEHQGDVTSAAGTPPECGLGDKAYIDGRLKLIGR